MMSHVAGTETWTLPNATGTQRTGWRAGRQRWWGRRGSGDGRRHDEVGALVQAAATTLTTIRPNTALIDHTVSPLFTTLG